MKNKLYDDNMFKNTAYSSHEAQLYVRKIDIDFKL